MPENPAGLDREIFNSDKAAYGHHLAEVFSESFYPAGEAVVTVFKNSTHRNSGASYRFTQEIAGYPVINGDLVVHTN